MKSLAKTLISFVCVVGFVSVLPHITNIFYQIVLGLCFGIVLSSLHESTVHQYLGHAKTKMRAFWSRHPWLFLSLIEGHFLHHVIHHGRTYREGYLEQFSESLDPKAVDAWAPEAFYRLFRPEDQAYVRRMLSPEKIVEHLHKADYGLGAASRIEFASTTLPLVAVVFVVAPFWIALGAALPLLVVYPVMSDVIHRNMMHVRQDGGASVHHDSRPNWLAGTVWMKALERWHWMHHEYIYCNYNLLVLADIFLGFWRRASAADLEKMAAEGLVMGQTWASFWEKSIAGKLLG